MTESNANSTIPTPPETAPCSSFSQTGLSKELLSACIHCGLCLPACPTYLATGREMESPRGRIHLLSMLEKGEVEAEPRLVQHLESCLGCLGCQTACPSGVQYGRILDQARPLLASKRNRRTRKLMRLVFAKILPDYVKLQTLGGLLRLWQRTGMKKVLERLPLGRKFFKRMSEWQGFLPKIPPFKPLPRQSWMSGEKKGEVQLFSGCVMNIFYNQVNHACLRLLTAQRKVVRVPEQTCCGALAFHSGEVDIARELAIRNLEYLMNTKGDIVVTAAGCGAMLKGYGELLEHDKEWSAVAADFSARVKDVTEALSDQEFAAQPKSVPLKVAYHAACHLAHAQNVHATPAHLLKSIPGLQLIPLEEAEHCCGSAGIFNLTHPEMSEKVLDRKMTFLKETGADVVVTTNPGCMLQLDAGIRDEGLEIKTMHIAELLDGAYSVQDS